jgi:hypothetical protein
VPDLHGKRSLSDSAHTLYNIESRAASRFGLSCHELQFFRAADKIPDVRRQGVRLRPSSRTPVDRSNRKFGIMLEDTLMKLG